MKARLRALLRHPFFLVIPLIILFVVGWHLYQQAAQGLNVAGHNILQGGGFDAFDAMGVPQGWTVARSGTLDYNLENIPAHVKGQALSLHVNRYKTGDVTLTSAKTNVTSGKTYLYKGYFKANGNFELLMRTYKGDGSSQLQLVRSFERTDGWSTVSNAFTVAPDVHAVQFMYRFTSKVTVGLDDTYLEQRDKGLYLPPRPAFGPNRIPNATLSQTIKGQPKDWTSFHQGENRIKASYEQGDNPYLRMTVSNYKSGEAKWQYAPQPVSGGQAYHFGVDYATDVPVAVVAEYVMKDGTRQFVQLTTLQPASQWTRIDRQFEVPAQATNMFVSVVLHQNGSLATDNYQLNDITRRDARNFERPLLSFTFDDGWESAYSSGASLLNSRHLKGTFYINPSTLDTPNFMTTVQMKDLQKRNNQIASHGYEHLDMTVLSQHRLNRELRTAHDYFVRQLGLPSTMDYASPYGRSDAEVQQVVRQNYRSQRSTDNGINTKQNFDPYNLLVLYVSSDTKPAALQQAIDKAKAQHGWLILVYHRIEGAHPGDATITEPAAFSQQLDQVQQSNIPVVTVQQAMQELQKQ